MEEFEKALRLLQAIRGNGDAFVGCALQPDGTFTLSYSPPFHDRSFVANAPTLKDALVMLQSNLRKEAKAALQASQQSLNQARADYDTIRAAVEVG